MFSRKDRTVERRNFCKDWYIFAILGKDSRSLVVLYDAPSKSATIRKPDVNIADDFTIKLVY